MSRNRLERLSSEWPGEDPARRRLEISPAVRNILRKAEVPSEFKRVVSDLLPRSDVVGPAAEEAPPAWPEQGPSEEGRVVSVLRPRGEIAGPAVEDDRAMWPQMNIPPTGMRPAEAPIQPGEMAATRFPDVAAETPPSSHTTEVFYQSGLTMDFSGAQHLTSGLLEIGNRPIMEIMSGASGGIPIGGTIGPGGTITDWDPRTGGEK